jgi:hypothetical protein
MANRIDARTASKFGVHFSSSEGDFPPRKKDIFPWWVLVHCLGYTVRPETGATADTLRTFL